MSDIDYSLYYSRFHDDSESHAEEMASWMTGLLKPHLPVAKDITVIDIGCGYGFALRAMRNLGFLNLMGLEASPEQAARTTAAGFKVEVVENSTRWLLQHEVQFDLVLLLDVLEHVPVGEQIYFARAIYGSLKPGGRLILTVPNANAQLAPRWRYGDFTHHCSFTEHSLDFVLRHAGFKDVQLDASKGIGRFPRRIWRRSSWPVIRKWLVRWWWLQVFQAELPGYNLDDISFELNLTAVAIKNA